MKKSILVLRSLIALLMLSFICVFSTACSCNEVSSKVVFDNFKAFIDKDNDLFKFDEETKKVVIDIPYDIKVEAALEFEREAYLNPTDESQPMYPYSDFYIFKSIYEPMLEMSISQIGVNYNILKAQEDQLDRVKCNTINENLKAVEKSTSDFMTMIHSLNNVANKFAVDQNGEYPYRDTNLSVYIELKNQKKIFENLIRDCFVLNNNFMDLYLTTLPDYDFNDIPLADFVDAEKNKSILPVVDSHLNYMVSILSYYSFMIDGDSCSFITSNESFSKIYAQKIPGEFASRYIYNIHHAKIADIKLFNLTNTTKVMTETYLNHMIACQDRFEVLLELMPYFNEAVDNVNYKDFIVSNISDPLEYAQTLTDNKKAHFLVVQNLLDDYFKPLAESLRELQTIMA